MDDDDYEVHPLDRDYSVTSQPARKRRSDLSKLHRIGFSTFSAGFVTVVLAAIVLGAFPDVGWLETIGSFMHRLAMYFILIGGVLILVAYSAPRRTAAAKEQERRRLERCELSTIDDAARAKDASIVKPASRLGCVSVIIAVGMIALTMASLYVFRFGINGRPNRAIMLKHEDIWVRKFAMNDMDPVVRSSNLGDRLQPLVPVLIEALEEPITTYQAIAYLGDMGPMSRKRNLSCSD